MKTNSFPEKVFPDLDADIRRQIKYDWTAIYSTSSRKAAELIANILSNYVSADSVITDATAGVGGNTALFSDRFKKVHAVELDPSRFSMLCHNMQLYKANNTIFYNADYLKICWTLQQDVVFLDPPWGGASVHLDKQPKLYLSHVPIEYICYRLINSARVVAVKVPMTYDVHTLRAVMKNYRVHHYRLRKMHLIVCSHSDAGQDIDKKAQPLTKKDDPKVRDASTKKKATKSASRRRKTPPPGFD